MACLPLFCCSHRFKQPYIFIASPDDLLTNDITTMYIDDDRYQIIEKKAHIIKKCRKFYNVWNFRIIKNLTGRHYLLVTSSQERNKWYIVLYDNNYINMLPKKISNKKEVLKIDYSVALENKKKREFFDIPLVD